MALTKNYTLAGTSYTIPNAYFVITKCTTEKRNQDVPLPADPTTATGYTQVTDRGPEALWKAGYITTIAVTVWATKNDKDEGKAPIGFIGERPTDNEYGQSISHVAYDQRCMFMLDINSSKNELTQAYEYLQTLEFFESAVNV